MSGTALNAVSLRSQGWNVQRVTGLDDLPTQRVPILTLPGRPDGVEGSRIPTVSPREITMTLHTRHASLSVIEQRLAWLAHVVTDPEAIAISHPRKTGKVLLARSVGGPADWGPGPGAVGPYFVVVTLRFVAANPYWVSATDQVLNFGTTAVPIPLGPYAVRGIIQLVADGATVADPIITIRKASTEVVYTVAPDVEILSGDAWELNCITERVRRRISGVWSDAADTMPLVYDIPILNPRHGVFGTSSPTIECDDANADGTLTYRSAS